jgi:hypothetical protein
MKAEITVAGALVVVPESGTEAYALQCWMERFPMARAEDCKPGATAIRVDLSRFPETLHKEAA